MHVLPTSICTRNYFQLWRVLYTSAHKFIDLLNLSIFQVAQVSRKRFFCSNVAASPASDPPTSSCILCQQIVQLNWRRVPPFQFKCWHNGLRLTVYEPAKYVKYLNPLCNSDAGWGHVWTLKLQVTKSWMPLIWPLEVRFKFTFSLIVVLIFTCLAYGRCALQSWPLLPFQYDVFLALLILLSCKQIDLS